jgi:hypothetical protein
MTMPGNVHTLSEVAEHFRQPEKFIRRLAASKEVPCLRGSRGADVFTDKHVSAIEAHLEQPAVVTEAYGQRRRRSA